MCPHMRKPSQHRNKQNTRDPLLWRPPASLARQHDPISASQRDNASLSNVLVAKRAGKIINETQRPLKCWIVQPPWVNPCGVVLEGFGLKQRHQISNTPPGHRGELPVVHRIPPRDARMVEPFCRRMDLAGFSEGLDWSRIFQ